MNEKEIMDIFLRTGAISRGHFLLTSGLHSPVYVEKFRIFENPEYTELLCRKLSEKLSQFNPDVTVGPMTGGILLAHEVSKFLHTKMMFTERVNGKMTFRRGFRLSSSDRVIIVEDVVTTGGSVLEVIDAVQSFGSQLLAVGCLVDRSITLPNFNCPMISLLRLEINTYTPDNCPMCAEKIPLTKPGSTNK
jgi:orotate phosphoribosyltransferase